MKINQQRYPCSALLHAIRRLVTSQLGVKPKASIHKQLSNEHVELVIQSQDAASCDVSRQHTTGKNKKPLMIANVSQYLGKVTLNKLCDYCLLSIV